jgi:hypothetical protein
MDLRMQEARFRRIALPGAFLALIVGLLGPCAVRADEDSPPPRVATIKPVREPGLAPGRPFPPRGSVVRRGEPQAEATPTGGWWLGTAGIALALAVCGGISVAARRGWRLPQVKSSGVLRVVGRTSLSPRHFVYLLRAGDRVLILGTGPQGAPSLLGELTDPDELERLTNGRRLGGDAR